MNKFLVIIIMLFMITSNLFAQQHSSTVHSDGSSSDTFTYDDGSSNTYNSDGSHSTTITTGNMSTTYNSDGSYVTTTEY